MNGGVQQRKLRETNSNYEEVKVAKDTLKFHQISFTDPSLTSLFFKGIKGSNLSNHDLSKFWQDWITRKMDGKPKVGEVQFHAFFADLCPPGQQQGFSYQLTDNIFSYPCGDITLYEKYSGSVGEYKTVEQILKDLSIDIVSNTHVTDLFSREERIARQIQQMSGFFDGDKPDHFRGLKSQVISTFRPGLGNNNLIYANFFVEMKEDSMDRYKDMSKVLLEGKKALELFYFKHPDYSDDGSIYPVFCTLLAGHYLCSWVLYCVPEEVINNFDEGIPKTQSSLKVITSLKENCEAFVQMLTENVISTKGKMDVELKSALEQQTMNMRKCISKVAAFDSRRFCVLATPVVLDEYKNSYICSNNHVYWIDLEKDYVVGSRHCQSVAEASIRSSVLFLEKMGLNLTCRKYFDHSLSDGNWRCEFKKLKCRRNNSASLITTCTGKYVLKRFGDAEYSTREYECQKMLSDDCRLLLCRISPNVLIFRWGGIPLNQIHFTDRNTVIRYDILRNLMQLSLVKLNDVHTKLQRVHNDIKPSNILVKQDLKDIYFIDFEFAQPSGRYCESGTSNYIAPERLLDPVQSFYQSDLFSLGVTFASLVFSFKDKVTDWKYTWKLFNREDSVLATIFDIPSLDAGTDSMIVDDEAVPYTQDSNFETYMFILKSLLEFDYRDRCIEKTMKLLSEWDM